MNLYFAIFKSTGTIAMTSTSWQHVAFYAEPSRSDFYTIVRVKAEQLTDPMSEAKTE